MKEALFRFTFPGRKSLAVESTMSKKQEYQLNEILWKEHIAPSITLFKVFTPIVAESVKEGQFVVVRTDDYAERVPLTVSDVN